MKVRKIIVSLLVLVMIASMLPVVRIEAQAYTTPPTISVSELDVKIHRLSTLLEGKYFTTTQVSCGNNVCDACMNVNVFEATWFKDMFGEVSVNQIPTHAYPYGETGTAAGWTCHGFANFAQWYLFSTSNSDKVTNYRVVDNVMMTRANMLKYAKPGDIIRYTYDVANDYGHSLIFVSANENNFTVIDNNFRWNGDAKSCVRTHTISYDSTIPMAISRANNYPTTPALSIGFDANGGTMEDSYVVRIATPMLRIRSSTSLSAEILGMIPDGTVVEVQDTKTAEGYTWAKVTYEGVTGWSAISGFSTREGYYLEGNVIYAYATSKPYTEIWNYGAGGTLASPSSLKLSREGYKFLGWSTSQDGSGTLFDPSDTSLKAEDLCPQVADGDRSIVLYAVWEDLNPAVLTFHYQGNGGTGVMTSQEAPKGSAIQLASNRFQKEGASFLGWHLQREDGMWYTCSGWDTQEQERLLLSDGAELVLDDSFVNTSESYVYTLHAVWQDNAVIGISVNTPPTKSKYTLNSSFDPTGLTLNVYYENGSSAVISEGFTVSQAVLAQVGQIPVEVQYKGHTAWVTVSVSVAPALSMGAVSGYLNETVTLPVVYSGNGNTDCYGLSMTVSYNPAELVYVGYSAVSGIDATKLQIIQSQQGQAKIIYTPDAPMSADGIMLWLHLQIAGQSQNSVYTIEATDAVFVDAQGASYNMGTTDGAVTNRGYLTLRYDAGLGSNAPAAVQGGFGQTFTVSSQIPVREGYAFAGWSLTVNDTVPDYQGGDAIVCMSDTVLHAVWQKRQMPTLTLNYPSLSFEDEILYNVYYTVDDASGIVEMGLITFNEKLTDGTITAALDVIPGYVSSGATYMVQSKGIPAKNLGDALYFKVYAKLSDGSYAYSDVAGYNAVAYAKTVLGSSTSSKEAKALMVAMLNYGAAAQEYFGYKTNAPMNSFLSAAGKALVAEYDPGMVEDVVKADASKAGQFVMNGGYSNIYPTVSFEGAFSINFYFTPNKTVDAAPTLYYWDAETYNNAAVLSTWNATGVLTMAQDGSNWGAAVEGIAAKSLDDTIYIAGFYTSNGVAYPTGVIAYSLGNYCKTIAANGTAFGAATAVYGYYAKAYFN